MRRPSCPTAIALGLALAGCSQSTGIPQVDKARDVMATTLGIGPELRPVGDAADRAARRAEAAGHSGRADEMATAVGRGAGEVACAGLNMRKPAARQAARTFDQHAPNIEHKDEAVSAYRSFVDRLPDMPNPCT